MATIAKHLPKQPLKILRVTWQSARNTIRPAYVPREPRDGEMLLHLTLPQLASGAFEIYARGDLLRRRYALPSDVSCVVVAAKPGYCRGGEGAGGWRVWEQLVVARLATDRDLAALATEIAADETTRVCSQD
jgi:hypothetical protein